MVANIRIIVGTPLLCYLIKSVLININSKSVFKHNLTWKFLNVPLLKRYLSWKCCGAVAQFIVASCNAQRLLQLGSFYLANIQTGKPSKKVLITNIEIGQLPNPATHTRVTTAASQDIFSLHAVIAFQVRTYMREEI